MEIAPLSQVSITSLVETFNAAFANYFVTFNMTDAYMRTRHQAARVDYDLSAAVIDKGQLVGFIITGVDDWGGKKTAYNAGTGVIPSYRGNKLTQQMYDYLFPLFKNQSIEQCLLEVIQQNEGAIKIYKSLGFQITRGFNCFSGQLRENLSTHTDFTIQAILEPNWERLQEFWSIQTAWDASISAIQTARGNYTIDGVFDNESCIGYAAYTDSGSLAQIAVHPSYRNQGIGKSLLHRVQKKTGHIKINNVQSDNWATLSFLQKSGLKNPINQYEMLLSLKK